jgi:hypothetical protein
MYQDSTSRLCGGKARSIESRQFVRSAGMARRARQSSAEEWNSREFAEAAFLKAVRGGQPQPTAKQIRSVPDTALVPAARRLLRLREECGCTAGAWSLAAAAVAVAIIAPLHGAAGLVAALGLTVLCLGCVMAASVAGKILAISVSRLRWRIERDRLLRHLAKQGEARDVMVW